MDQTSIFWNRPKPLSGTPEEPRVAFWEIICGIDLAPPGETETVSLPSHLTYILFRFSLGLFSSIHLSLQQDTFLIGRVNSQQKRSSANLWGPADAASKTTKNVLSVPALGTATPSFRWVHHNIPKISFWNQGFSKFVP